MVISSNKKAFHTPGSEKGFMLSQHLLPAHLITSSRMMQSDANDNANNRNALIVH
jgi:hypothetical protein